MSDATINTTQLAVDASSEILQIIDKNKEKIFEDVKDKNGKQFAKKLTNTHINNWKSVFIDAMKSINQKYTGLTQTANSAAPMSLFVNTNESRRRNKSASNNVAKNENKKSCVII